MKKKIFIFGSGSWGTALASVVADNQNDVLIYGRNTNQVNDINVNHQNNQYFPNINLPNNLKATSDISKCADYDIILLATPSSTCVQAAYEIDKYLKKPTIFINAAKGFHPQTFRRLSEVITETVNKDHLLEYFALSGPSFASEVVQKQITTVNIRAGSSQSTVNESMKSSFSPSSPYLTIKSRHFSETVEIIHRRTAAVLHESFGRYLPEATQGDFYEMELGTAGMMRSFMARRCDPYFTPERKVRRFLEMTLRAFHVPETETAQIIAYVAKLDIRAAAKQVLDELFQSLSLQFELNPNQIDHVGGNGE